MLDVHRIKDNYFYVFYIYLHIKIDLKILKLIMCLICYKNVSSGWILSHVTNLQIWYFNVLQTVLLIILHRLAYQ